MIYTTYSIGGELYHHGVKGMKWGVRRYQNYDGSYTRKGVENFNKSMANYENARYEHKMAKKLYKQSKKNGYVELNGQKIRVEKSAVKDAKNQLKRAKSRLNRDYKQLSRDKAGDKGKDLYNRGKTITGNAQNLQIAGLITSGTVMASRYLKSIGKDNLAKYAALAGIGLNAANAAMAVKNGVEARYLRAYYTHNRK